MKTETMIAALVVIAMLATAADKVPDLTGAEAKEFKAHLGRVVTLRGRMEQGVQGPCLFGAIPKGVAFYVIPKLPARGIYSYPENWNRLMHREVRLTGELKFRSFSQANRDAGLQTPPDYYYMVLQDTAIQAIEAK